MENLHELTSRIERFAPFSLEGRDSLSTRSSASLTCKVDSDGKLLPFYGNTVVFMLGEDENRYVLELQDALYRAFGEESIHDPQNISRHAFTRDRLAGETLHMTLHDLANPTNDYSVADTRDHALDVLEQVRQDFFPDPNLPIEMIPRWIFSMMDTSIVLGLVPADEENCRRLLGMYERFHEVVKLGFPFLTPHVTLAYYRPMDLSAAQLDGLREVMRRFNQSMENRPAFRLFSKNLVYQEFEDMNHYRTISRT